MRVIFLSLLLFSTSFASFESRKLTEKESADLIANCGKFESDGNFEYKVLNGKAMGPGEVPWVVSLIFTGDLRKSMCSGTLISSRHVLTAGHCVDVIRADCNSSQPHGTEIRTKNVAGWKVNMAASCSPLEKCKELNRNETPIVRGVRNIFIPYNFTGFVCDQFTLDDDMAIFEMDEDVPFSELVFPACVASEFPSEGRLSGYGFGLDPSKKTTKPEEERGVLRAVEWKEVECSKFERNFSEQICAHSEQSGVLGCGGDSGHGMIHRRKTGQAEIVATYSSGADCDKVLAEFQKNPNGPRIGVEIFMGIPSYLHLICKATGLCVRESDRSIDDTNMFHVLSV